MARYRVGNMYLSQEEYDDHNRRTRKTALFVGLVFVLAVGTYIAKGPVIHPLASDSRTKRPTALKHSKQAEKPKMAKRRPARTAIAASKAKASKAIRVTTAAQKPTELAPVSYTTPEGRVVIIAPPPRSSSHWPR